MSTLTIDSAKGSRNGGKIEIEFPDGKQQKIAYVTITERVTFGKDNVIKLAVSLDDLKMLKKVV